MTKHKWRDVIVAFAEGKKIQYRYGDRWHDWNDNYCPLFSDGEYRIKPETRQFRVALFRHPGDGRLFFSVSPPSTYKAYEEGDGFVRWVTDEIEVEV